MEEEWKANGGLMGMMGMTGSFTVILHHPLLSLCLLPRRGHADDDADDGDEGALPVHLLRRGLWPDGHAHHGCGWQEIGQRRTTKDCKIGSLAASLANIFISVGNSS